MEVTPKPYLEGLTEQQIRAVTAPFKGATSVLGGCGEGSREVLVARVAYLVERCVLTPSRVVVFTHNKDDTKDIKRRLKHFSALGEVVGGKIKVGTFEDICRDYLKKNAKDMYLPDPSSVKAPPLRHFPQTQRAFETLEKSRLKDIPRYIRRAKQARVDRTAYISTKIWNTSIPQRTAIADIVQHHATLVTRGELQDCDDVLVKTLELLTNSQTLYKLYQSVVVDAFEQATVLQHDIAILLGRACQSMTVVGDPDAAIWSWASADAKCFERIPRNFASSRSEPLELNTRSSGAIIQAANLLIQQDTTRIPKTISSNHPSGPQLVLQHAPNDKSERTQIVATIESVKKQLNGLVTYDDFAILVRFRSMRAVIGCELKNANLPFTEGNEEGKIQLLTIHSAANRDWPIVFIPGVENGMYPSYKLNTGDQDEQDEERRALYFAITRARTHCIMSHAHQRVIGTKLERRSLSPFIDKTQVAEVCVPDLAAVTEETRREAASILNRPLSIVAEGDNINGGHS